MFSPNEAIITPIQEEYDFVYCSDPAGSLINYYRSWPAWQFTGEKNIITRGRRSIQQGRNKQNDPCSERAVPAFQCGPAFGADWSVLTRPPPLHRQHVRPDRIGFFIAAHQDLTQHIKNAK